MSHLLFVYGTLTPGRAPACVDDLVSQFKLIGPATVRGVVYHLDGYPGLILGDESLVHGFLCELPADELLWRRLDNYEGFHPTSPASSLFCRVPAVAILADGRRVECQTYVYNRPVDKRRAVLSGNWLDRVDRPAPQPQTEIPRMTRPIIGITSDYVDENPTRYMCPSDYARSVALAGGLPMMLPFRVDLTLIPDYIDALDGILFTGGNDLTPSLYGQELHPKAVTVEPARQTFELALIAEVERRRIPALGICLGCQLMNVHRGGSLNQFLPDLGREVALEHRHLGNHDYRHEVKIEPGTVLADWLGQERVSVNSRHKQSILKVGRGLRVNATAPDGVIEGIEDPSLPLFLGIQWHGENLSTNEPHLKPFQKLVEAARKK